MQYDIQGIRVEAEEEE